MMFVRRFTEVSAVSMQGAGRHKETDDEGSPPPAEEGRVPSDEREAEE